MGRWGVGETGFHENEVAHLIKKKVEP